MKSRLVKILCMAAVLILTISIGCISALADEESYTASQMRLLQYEGEVEILNADGESRFVLENVRFDSGETMKTGEESMASVELDEERIVTLDEKTSVEFIQEGDSMKMNLLEGTMLLDVQDKLDENETLDIQTDNMTVGIRGTTVIVSNLPPGTDWLKFLSESSLAKILPLLNLEGKGTNADSNADATITVFTVLNGNVNYSWTDTDGSKREINVPAGTKAILVGAGGEDVSGGPVVTPVTADDLNQFVTENLADNRKGEVATMLQNGQGSTTNPYDPKGVWSYQGKVTLVAQSASKMYDGTELTENDILVSGLPEGFSIVAKTGGSLLDVGKCENPISSYSIYNTKDEEVTDHFENVELVSGQLVVDPAPLLVRTDNAEKVYDGQPLVAKEVAINGYEGLQAIESGQNISYINTQPFALDEETKNAFAALGKTSFEDEDQGALYGVVGEVMVHGTNPITGEIKEITLLAGEKLTIFINEDAGEGEESIEFNVVKMKEEEIPLGLLQIYADNEDVLEQACKEAEWDIEKVQSLISLLPEKNEETVLENGVNVRKNDTGSTLQDFTNVWINVDTDITDYNERPLDKKETQYLPVTVDPSIVVKATGKQTDVGESTNTYEIDWNEAKKSNYIVSEELGTLKVTKADVTVITASADKVYDGKALTNPESDIEGLVEGERATVVTTGTQTDVGESKNFYTISWSTAKADNYNVVEELGTLSVTKADMIVTTGSAKKQYDGEPLTCDEYTTEGLAEDESVNITLTGSQTEVGSSANTYTIEWDNADESNYTLTEELGTLTVTKPGVLIITTGSAEKTYDGTPLTSDQASITGLEEDENVTITTTGSITDAGTAVNTYNIDWGDVDPSKYTIVENLGTLKVNKAEATVSTGSATKVYDGTVLTNAGAEITGLIEGESVKLTATGSQTDAGESANTYKIEWTGADANNYKVTDKLGTLKVTQETLKIITSSAEKEYDGKALTNAEVDVIGLIDGETVNVAATGTITDTGETENTYIIDWRQFNPSNYTVTEELGTLKVTPAEVTIETGSATRTYDGTALTSAEAEVNGLAEGESVTITTTGSQTAVGESENTYEIEWTGADENNYTISDSLGTLKVNKAAVTIETGTATKTYDGKTLFSTQAKATGLAKGESVTITTTGTITDVGKADNTYKIEWTRADAANYTVTDKLGTLEVTPAEVTIETGSATRDYDGTALTSTESKVTGLAKGESVTITTTGSQKVVGASDNTYEIEWSGADAENYTVTDKLGTLTVTKAAVTIETGSASKKYDGTALTSAEAKATGLAEGENVTITTTGTITNVGSAENTYEIDWGDIDSSNYTVTDKLGTLSVTKAAVTIETGTATKTYDGKALTSAEVTVTGLASGEEPTITTTGTITKVGSANNTYTIDWGDIYSANYTVTDKLGTLTVTKAAVTIETGSATKTYDGKALTSTEAKATGLADGESVTITTTGTITDVGEADNTYSIEWSGADAANYTVTDKLGTLKVTQETLKIITGSAEKEYDGKALTNTEADVIGLIDGETINVATTGTITNTGETENTYTIDWGEYNPSNYKVTEELGTLKVTPAEVTIETGSATRTYDGTALTSDEAEVNGLAEGESVAITTTGSQTVVGESENTYEIEWSGADENNYTISDSLGTLKVNKAAVTIETGTATKAYDGTALTSSSVKVTGLASGEEPTITTTGTITKAGSANNTYTIDWGDIDSDNYTVTDKLGTLTVTQTEVTIETGSASKKYDGIALTNSKVTVTGLASGEEPTITTTGTITKAGSANNTYTIDWGDIDSDNYTVTDKLGTLTVTQAEVTIETGSAKRTYNGAALTSSEVTVTGLASGEEPTITTTGTITKVGSANNTYTIDWGDIDSDNYTVTDKLGTLTVTQAEVTIETGTATKTYDGKALTNSGVTVTGLASSEEPTITTTGTITKAGSANNTYTIDWGEIDSANYTVTDKLGTLEVTKATVTIETGTATKTYDGKALTSSSVTVTGLASGEEPTITTTGTITKVGSAKNTYTINWGDINSDNYTVTDKLGTLEVTQAEVTIKTSPATREYNGEALKNSEVTVTGLADGESVTVTATGSQTDAGSSDNTYDIKWTGADENNYKVTEELGILEVTPLEIEFDLTFNEESIYTYCGYERHFPEWIFGTYVNLPEGENEVTCEDEPELVFADEQLISESFIFNLIGDAKVKLTCDGIIDAGEYTGENAITPTVEFLSGTEGNYSFSYTGNQITIEPLEIEISLVGGYGDDYPVIFDGNFHGGNPLVYGYVEEEELYYDCEIEPITATEWKATLPWGDALNIVITGGGTNAGNYTLSCSYPEDEKNYVFSIFDDILEIDWTEPVTFTTASDSKTYDGTKLENTAVTASGLPEGYTFEASAGGNASFIDANEYVNPFTPMEYTTVNDDGNEITGTRDYAIYDADGNDVTDNFTNVECKTGTLTINKRNLTVTSATKRMPYDFTENPLTDSSYTINTGDQVGLVEGDTITVSVTGEQVGIGSSDNICTVTFNNPEKANNYDLNIVQGTLEITKLDVVVDACGYDIPYDGNDHYPDKPKLIIGNNETVETDNITRSGDTVTAVFNTRDGSSITVTVKGGGKGPDTYTLNVSCTTTGADWINGDIGCINNEIYIVEPETGDSVGRFLFEDNMTTLIYEVRDETTKYDMIENYYVIKEYINNLIGKGFPNSYILKKLVSDGYITPAAGMLTTKSRRAPSRLTSSEPPTEPETKPAEELEKEPETEPETEPPTEPETKPAEELETEPPTEPETESAEELETEPPTQPPTDPPTDPPTEPATEPETEPPTEPETEPQTESETNPEISK